ncbi:MAG: serine hydrolase, partial [Flavobacteriaceae bacterium]|nr:serine hydrolase [Flavobacteriaceae bacterium]
REGSGKLPVSLGTGFPLNTHYETKALKRLQYGTPESVGMNTYILQNIDSLALKGLEENMMPGAQIVVARKGKVIYNKSFGHHTPSQKREVAHGDIYDIASLTKILATVPMIMKLVDQEELSMDTTLEEMLPEFEDSNKADITLKEMLTHTARLQAWIPFYQNTLNERTKKPSSKYYRKNPTKNFNVQVADDLFMRNDYVDSIYKIIKESDLRDRKGYKYSDLPYYLLKKYLEKYYGLPLETIVQEQYYESLGANYTTYRPLEKFSKSQITPSEDDSSFRYQKVQGYVHDQGAAMLGGVSGHAGLFSNANDVAKVMQLYLNRGYYGGKRYFEPETLDLFNTCYYCEEDIRRGVGFDKPQLGDVGPTCGCVSMTSFGHSGFTGTFTWADPEQEIVYVFLSNRTFPNANNRKIISSNLRSDIQQVIYQAIDY